ncbi:MAG: tetratricopeptide repeat protein [Sulfuricurvum sp.]|jgi:tetratricopeptide (TPR) repeat protein|uniref:tetratricopeptide repeat protein n=1 Tax=Sulfuricurvum sp. TaxID=2025608 RepID=UPI0025DD820C|nr:tetratricopeptide repeat protein [Sulfuricurvum sp.]MCK9373064.1 tetratricopeptide repeat protein [Sulfuricurvum sp.]
MSIFQILMFGATLFFAYQIFRHVQNLEDSEPSEPHSFEDENIPFPSSLALVEEADEAYQKGELSTAKERLQQAVQQDENSSEILNKLAFVTAKTGETSEAIALYKRSLLLDERDDLTHNALASLYRIEGERALAQEHYEKALAIDAAYPQTYFNYGNLLSDMGNTLKAGEMYLKALELQSDFPQAREALEALRGKK